MLANGTELALMRTTLPPSWLCSGVALCGSWTTVGGDGCGFDLDRLVVAAVIFAVCGVKAVLVVVNLLIAQPLDYADY
jgi:hypothetical protein